MKKRIACLLSFLLSLYTCTALARHQQLMHNVYDTQESQSKVNEILSAVSFHGNELSYGERIAEISSRFLGTPYQAHTLIGSSLMQERLVTNPSTVDCFTFIDYVRSMAHASSWQTYVSELVKTRYTNGMIDFTGRKHFFTDWAVTSPRNAQDVTQDISPYTITVNKRLNQKNKRQEYVKGLGIISRRISYIPASAIDKEVINKLKTGDYVGIYSTKRGLDVSHVGIIIKDHNNIWFRNASSLAKNRKVVDSPFIREGANKQVISSQADSLIKISRIWADFFPA
ncbi:DUF1460 domain-containing protein, partial [Klebsiella pneumoniae]|nr:DUF1460 domain-containing protein [Klebsiella pneumoniae]MDZ1916166.1 DUF1460 domain-containing protein [Klebsiella pneumoniae]